jgi:cation/acetate symporter
MLQTARLVNPKLGLYFGIYASVFVGGVLLALLLEQIGTADGLLRGLMFAVPVTMFAIFGYATATSEPLDFLVAGRRVPPFFAGAGLAVTALGGVGLVCLTGAIFLLGSDAFALVLGWLAGLVVMAIVLVPFLRKFGAFTVPGYLGVRFESRVLRVAAAALLAVPVLLLLVAEILVAAEVAGQLTGQPTRLVALLLVVVAALPVLAGGMRALTWASAAKAVAMLMALLVPVTIVSLVLSNLPFPQITSGNISRTILRSDLARGVPLVLAGPWVFDLPGTALEPLGRRFLQMFSAIGPTAFSATVLVIMAGVASQPALLARAGTTPGVHAARQAMGWAVLLLAFSLLTMAAVAVFLRSAVVDQIVGVAADSLPPWFQQLQQAGLASVMAKGSATVLLPGTAFRRDAALFALPVAAGLPVVLTYLALAGALAAGLAAMSAQMLALGTSLAEDVLLGVRAEAIDTQPHVLAGRVGIVVAASAGAVVSFVPADPLQLALWSIAITASAGFPVLVLSILWKRLNAWGAVAGMVTGFIVVVALIIFERMGLSVLAGPLPAVVAMPSAVLAAVIISQLTPAVSRNSLELLRDMRVPGGETLMDRDRRLARLKQAR